METVNRILAASGIADIDCHHLFIIERSIMHRLIHYFKSLFLLFIAGFEKDNHVKSNYLYRAQEEYEMSKK